MSEDGRCRTCGTITNLPPRLTHAEQALKGLGHASGLVAVATCRDHLDKAAEIERLAREVVTEWDNINNPDEPELGRTMDRLRALVQP